MTCLSPLQQQYSSLTVLDVYDEAALIGKDFERIIEAYGTETIRDLVPKVIRILELLELQAAKNEKDEDEFVKMKSRIERLETEKNETRELRDKFDRELDFVEEQWRKEADNLMALVSKLQDENRRLRDDLERNSDLHNKSDLPSPSECISITREELLCIKNLTEENIRLKRMIKSKDKDLIQKTLNIEAVQAQLERVCKVNCTLRQKNTFSANQTQRLMIEKFDLEVQLKEKENFIHHMKDRVSDELVSPNSPTNPINDLTTLEANQPRFTLEELRQVLWERNDLKTKLMEVEEELRLFKDQEDDDSNAPVEGPIPLEPEEKLYGYKRDESKVRQFVKICLFFPTIACFAVASFCLRSIFPMSKKSSSPFEQHSPIESSVIPSTPIPLTLPVNQTYSACASPSIHSNASTSRRLSVDSLFGSQRKSNKPSFPLLSPPPSE
ncbi:unnamed protein product [Adineta steineri]|uniref:RILP-like protein n=1 Tax=Adineta steineri TaxID=433720 RepID=A0A814X834_9BILA|nr:unnamed protein product [Adineta steineri]